MALDSKAPMKIVAGADSFGCELKEALVAHLRSLNIDVEDIGTDKYYTAGQEIGRRVSSDPTKTRGLLACGTGVGVSIFANKFPGVYASTCVTVDEAVNTRSINDCNVLSVSGMKTSPEEGIKILDAWLQTPFKAPCPASGNQPWSSDLSTFLDSSLSEMPRVPEDRFAGCPICCFRKNMDFVPVDVMPGGTMKIVRESPTSAIVRFKAGSVEPAHHHTFGHDLVVMKGKKKVWNLSRKESYELEDGDFLFTPAGDVHRVKYYEDTEFFIRWDGDWDIFLDEDVETARAAVEKESASVYTAAVAAVEKESASV